MHWGRQNPRMINGFHPNAGAFGWVNYMQLGCYRGAEDISLSSGDRLVGPLKTHG